LRALPSGLHRRTENFTDSSFEGNLILLLT
jgi:hypothetical protein